jgi:hypothetical protein
MVSAARRATSCATASSDWPKRRRGSVLTRVMAPSVRPRAVSGAMMNDCGREGLAIHRSRWVSSWASFSTSSGVTSGTSMASPVCTTRSTGRRSGSASGGLRTSGSSRASAAGSRCATATRRVPPSGSTSSIRQ